MEVKTVGTRSQRVFLWGNDEEEPYTLLLLVNLLRGSQFRGF